MAASRVKAKFKIDFPVPGLVVVSVSLLGFVDAGIVVGGLGSISQIRNKIIAERIYIYIYIYIYSFSFYLKKPQQSVSSV